MLGASLGLELESRGGAAAQMTVPLSIAGACISSCDWEYLSQTDCGKLPQPASAGSPSHDGEASDARVNECSSGTATAEARSVGRG